jgi:F-type H+-transporting ATPase subunit gamma
MANARKLDKRRKSIRNIKKITRTMELIATARFKKAMDRAAAATGYTKRITAVVADLASAGLEVSHPLLIQRQQVKNSALLLLTANRGLCGGYNGNVIRLAIQRRTELAEMGGLRMEVSGKRGVSGFKFRKIPVDAQYLNFEDQPKFVDVERIADQFIRLYISGQIDRLDVAYTKFLTSARQQACVETLLPLGKLEGADAVERDGKKGKSIYEFIPSAQSILDEVVPTSFRVKLFKCFLDAAVSEQIARMIAMKNATENANEMIKLLSRTYNRARQGQITGEIMEVIGGVEALEN